MWTNLIWLVGAEHLNYIHTFPQGFFQLNSRLGLWTEVLMNTQNASGALLAPVFCFRATCIQFMSSPLLGKPKRGKWGWSGNSVQRHELDPHQNMKVDVLRRWLTERELVWLSQGWELEPAPQHAIPAPSSQTSFLLVPSLCLQSAPGSAPALQSTHLHVLCTSRWV